ncbi:MAG TPA: DUF5666 domain-containing protein [Thermoanaerobaculia bacterium]
MQIMILAVAMLAACNSRHETATSPYGAEMLMGEVAAVSGTANASPAGVTVSVRGTGMSMVVGESGEFAFAGVREGAQLDFRRAADGIEASMNVDARGGFVAVELTKTTATATTRKSRRRGVGATREAATEFEGIIRSVTAGNIVLYTSKKAEVTIGLTPETIIRKGQTPVAAADLQVDWRVHVKAKQDGELYTASVVIVQNDGSDDDGDDGEDGPAAARQHEGTVVSAAAAELVVLTSHKVEVTFAITADTVIRKGNTPVAAEELQAGWRVHVKATADNVATRVTVQNTKK